MTGTVLNLVSKSSMVTTKKHSESGQPKNGLEVKKGTINSLFMQPPASIDQFNECVNDIADIKFLSKAKEDGYSIHKVAITTISDQVEYGHIIKASGNGRRTQKPQMLGAGSFKYVQAVILIRNGKPPLKVALSTQEFSAPMPDFIMDELKISKRLKKELQSLHESVLIPNYVSVRIGTGHESSDGNKVDQQMLKLIGVMPISPSAKSLYNQGTNKDKLQFIQGAIKTLHNFGKLNQFNGDIKPANMDWRAVVIDHGGMGYNCHYGSPGFHALYQQHPDFNETGSIQNKQRQDAFAMAASIYEVLTGSNLDCQPAHGGFASNQYEYKLTPLRADEFNEKIVSIHKRISEACFPFSRCSNDGIKRMLYQLTGTETNGQYSDGNNLYGADVETLYKLLV